MSSEIDRGTLLMDLVAPWWLPAKGSGSLIEFISISKGGLVTLREDKPGPGAERLAKVPTCPGKGKLRQGQRDSVV